MKHITYLSIWHGAVVEIKSSDERVLEFIDRYPPDKPIGPTYKKYNGDRPYAPPIDKHSNCWDLNDVLGALVSFGYEHSQGGVNSTENDRTIMVLSAPYSSNERRE